MVVPVEEDKWLFPKDNEDCVTQLRYFAECEHPIPETSHTVVQETAKNKDCQYISGSGICICNVDCCLWGVD